MAEITSPIYDFSSIVTEYVAGPAIPSTFLNFFNDRVSALLTSPIIKSDDAFMDDSVKKFDFNGEKGWPSSAYFAYDSEGTVGLELGLTKRNSGFTEFGRYYLYNSVEYDFLFTCRNRGRDQGFNLIRLAFDERYVAVYLDYRLSYSDTSRNYQYYFIIDKNNSYNLVESFLISNVLWDNEFLAGYKNYYRDVIQWSPIVLRSGVPVFTRANSIFDPIPKTSKKFMTPTNYSYNELVDRLPMKNIQHVIKDQIQSNTFTNYLNYGNANITKTRDLSFFIEGAESNKDYQVILESNEETKKITLKNNDVIQLPSLKLTDYKIKVDSLNYYRKLNMFSPEMVKGTIRGSVNLKNCSTRTSSFEIQCYRDDDNLFIGRYQISENGQYIIENLDCNSFYNILLVDKYNPKTVETLVNSRRQPSNSNYRKYYAPEILGLKSYKYDNKIYLYWNYGFNDDTKIEQVKVYLSKNVIDINDLSKCYFIYSDLYSCIINSNLGYKYIIVECIYNDSKTYSQQITITETANSYMYTGVTYNA